METGVALVVLGCALLNSAGSAFRNPHILAPKEGQLVMQGQAAEQLGVGSGIQQLMMAARPLQGDYKKP